MLCSLSIAAAPVADGSANETTAALLPPGLALAAAERHSGPSNATFVYDRGVRSPWKKTQGIVEARCNLVYVKILKCASSTTGGVARRIAAHFHYHGSGSDEWITDEPGVYANHGSFGGKDAACSPRYGCPSLPLMATLSRPAFLFTFVRSPAARCLSKFYHFHASRRGTIPTDSMKIEALNASSCHDSVYHYMTADDSITPRSLVRSVYSFVGVVELYDQSLVVLASLLGVPLGSVLYLASKNSSAGGSDGQGTTFVPHVALSDESDAVQRFATGDHFRMQNSRDLALHIEAYSYVTERFDANREVLQGRATEFAALLDRSRAECDGATEKGDCYWNDNGCGVRCLDRIAGSPRGRAAWLGSRLYFYA